MALTFGAATSDRVEIGSASPLDDMVTGTAWVWTRIGTLTTPRCFFGKNANLACNVANPSALNIRLIRATSGTNIIYTTNDNPLVTGQWLFIAVTWDFAAGSGRGAIYTGDLATLATERTYGTAQDGTGTITTDAAAPWQWGNNGVSPTPALALQGDLAYAGLINRRLTVEELRSIQRRPRAVSGSLNFTVFGYNGTGTQWDWSGSGNNGTVTGASLTASHLPLRRWRRGGSRVAYAAASTTYSVTLSGSLTPAGALTRRTTKLLAGGATPAGALVRRATKLLAGGATPSGALSTLKVIIRTMAGAITPAGALVRQVTKRLTAGATPAAALAKLITKPLAGGATPSAALASLKVIIRTMAGAITPSGAILRQAGKALAGAATPVGALVRQARRALAGALTPAGALVKSVTRRFAGTLAPVGALVTTFFGAGAIVLMRLVAGLVVRPLYAAGTRLVARFRGSPDVGPEA